jgi:hypothetical protein
MKSKIPKIKKKISSYLLSEEGKISKQALLTMGAFLGGAAIGTLISSEDVDAATGGPCKSGPDCTIETAQSAACKTYAHCNHISLSYSGGTATAAHTHHASY